MRITNFPNLYSFIGESSSCPATTGRFGRMLLGATIGCAIALVTLLFIAALVRWSIVLRLWPNACVIGSAFGAMVGLLHKRPEMPDARFGECRRTNDIVHFK